MAKNVLVTGAAGGIGRAIVSLLLERGWAVTASDRDASALASAYEDSPVRRFVMDVRDEAQVKAIADWDLDAAVNNAGWGATLAEPTEVDPDVIDRAFAINARGTLLVTKHAARAMIRGGKGGAIVNLSSQAAIVALPGHTVYAASKAAVDSITRTSASELGRYRIRVNAVNPTTVLTPMSLAHWSQPEIEGPFLAAMPLGRWATERDIAGPVAFLLSDDAAMITGVSLPIDGGYTVR